MTADPNTSLKVLHVLDHSLPLHSGYAFRSHNIFQSQFRRGWRPVVVTSPKHEQSCKGERHSKEVIGDIPYFRTGETPSSRLPFATELCLMVALAKRLRQVIELETPDLLHAHSSVLNALPALYVGRKLGIPVVYEIRAFWEDAAVDHGTYRENSWKYKLVKSIETWVCRKADQVAVLCQGLKSDLIRRGIPSEKLTIVFNGINVKDFTTCEPDRLYQREWGLSGKKVIGFIGSFYRYEGLDLLVEAFARLASARSDVALLLVGGGEMDAEIRGQVRRLRLEDKVVMPGRIPHERVPGVYGLVDILAYPRYSMRLTELVTPLKPLEAMAMGKVLVASDIGGHRELIQDGKTGLLFPAGDLSALVGALTRLLSDQVFRERLEEQAIVWVRQEHTWDKTTAVYSEIYARALKDNRVEVSE